MLVTNTPSVNSLFGQNLSLGSGSKFQCAFYDTPIGSLIGVFYCGVLVGLEFDDVKFVNQLVARLKKYEHVLECEVAPADFEENESTLRNYLKLYFESPCEGSLLLPKLKMHVVASAFEQSVLKHLFESVGVGSTTTYGAIAGALNLSPRAARAVGNVMNRNPLKLIYPCHRVVHTHSKKIGFAGGASMKLYLLQLEERARH